MLAFKFYKVNGIFKMGSLSCKSIFENKCLKIIKMKSVFLGILLLLTLPVFASTFSLTQVRFLYQKAAKEEKSCKQLIALLKSYNEENDPLLSGYKACATMMMAKYTINPFSKLSFFKQGKNELQKAIAADNSNIELRFLRFGIQTNIPFFLGYKGDIDTDKNFLVNSILHINDSELKSWIVSYLNESNNLTFTEKRNIK